MDDADTLPPTKQPTEGGAVRIVVNNGAPADVPEVPDAAPGGRAPAGVPSGAASEPTGIFSVPVVTEGVDMLFDAIAERRGAHWAIDEDQAEAIAEPLTGELNDLAKVLPFHDAVAGALSGRRSELALALGIVVVPRLRRDMHIAAEQRRLAAIARRNPNAPAREPVRDVSRAPGTTPREPDAPVGLSGLFSGDMPQPED